MNDESSPFAEATHKECDGPFLRFVALHHNLLWVQIVHVHAQLEQCAHLLLQHLDCVFPGQLLAIPTQFQLAIALERVAASALGHFHQLVQRQCANLFHGQRDVVVTFQCLLDLYAHQ